MRCGAVGCDTTGILSELVPTLLGKRGGCAFTLGDESSASRLTIVRRGGGSASPPSSDWRPCLLVWPTSTPAQHQASHRCDRKGERRCRSPFVGCVGCSLQRKARISGATTRRPRRRIAPHPFCVSFQLLQSSSPSHRVPNMRSRYACVG